jgi:hypothetical protein
VLKAGFFSSAQTGLETALLAGRPHRGMGSHHKQFVGCRARDVAFVMGLHELAPVGRRHHDDVAGSR